MLHFPSKLPTNFGPNGAPRRTDSLNATQQLRSATAAGAHPLFLKIEEELHDARRVHADGQEDDLRYALNMVIDRVSNLVCTSDPCDQDNQPTHKYPVVLAR